MPHRFRLRAVNARGVSRPSAEVSAMPLAPMQVAFSAAGYTALGNGHALDALEPTLAARQAQVRVRRRSSMRP